MRLSNVSCTSVRRVLYALLVAVGLVTFVVGPISVFAIADPDTGPSISQVDAYKHCLEPDDLLLIALYDIEYVSLPDETATDAFIGRLMLDSVVVDTSVPFAYHDKGYGWGIIAFYLDASESPTWSGNYEVQLMGNPSLSWTGDPPSTSSAVTTWHSTSVHIATQLVLGSHIIDLAAYLGIDWELTLYSVVSGDYLLTSIGEQYFENSILGLRDMVPNVFSAGVTTPTYAPKTEGPGTYFDILSIRWDNYFDFSGLGSLIGLGDKQFRAVLWFAVIGLIGWLIVGMGIDPRAVPLILFVSVPVGAINGMLYPQVAVVSGFVALLLIGFTFAWGRSTV